MASDSDSDGDFVTFGTPLEPLEEDEPLRKPIPLHEQTVKDEKGRYQRFHGAFTGGFSAGYFNTVGTKEGWTPATFVSSRQQKAGRQNARPEDFMDEEDLGEHGIAPRQITTTADFASGRTDVIRDKARVITSLSAPIPGDTVLEDLVAPARSSMGVELLRKMGWKDGQGVGPRVKRRLCRQKADSRVFGSVSPPNGSSESQDEEDGEFVPDNVTFAPKDVTPIDFTPKVDRHGLGYRGLNPLAALRGGPGAGHINLFTMDSDRTNNLFGEDKKGQKRRGGVAGQGFGVGAMEDDDDDIYHRDIMSNYDTVLGGEEPGDGLYGWTAPQQYNRKKKDHSKDAAYLGKILEGFTLSSDKMEAKTIFPPPNLPRDFRPVHYFRPVVDMSSVSPMVAQALKTSRGHMTQEEPSKGGRHQLDSAQRRELLGEAALQGPSSVFDLLKAEDRERLSGLRRPSSDTSSGPRQPTPGETRAAVVAAGVAAAAARASAQKALSSRFAPQAEQQQEALSVWSGPTAQAQTGQTFKPFERTPHKQARYDLYIDQLKQGDRDALELSLDPTMTEWERGRERDEFVRAALLYKPSSSSLSCRFTRAKQDDGVEADAVEVTRDQENDVDDKQAAVKMKMFGKLTRDTFEWHPDKLLCKRFNIPDPYPESGFVGMPKVKRDKFSVFNFLTVSESPTASASPAPQAVKPSEPGKRSRWDVSGQAGDKERKEKDPVSEFLSVARIEASGSGPDTSTTDDPTTDPTGEPDTEKKDEEEEVEEEENRPPMDLFKAIFASSSDEKSSSSSEGESEEEEEEGVRSKAGTGPQISNQLNVNTTRPAPPVSVSATPGLHPDVVFKTPSGPAPAPPPRDQEMEEEEFGPRLPPASSTLTAERRPSPTPSAKDDKHKKKCKEKHKAKKYGKHKKDKKQKKKHKRHKHKAKQKKSSRKEESSDSSSEGSDGNSQEDGEEGGGVSTEELLKRLKSIRGKNLQ